MSNKTYTLKGLEPWIALVENQMVWQAVKQTAQTRQVTLVALALSVAKWHPANKNRGYGNCGLCELYNCECGRCILNTADEVCVKSGSLWGRFVRASSPKEEKKYSRELYDLLVKLYAEEYRRVMS